MHRPLILALVSAVLLAACGGGGGSGTSSGGSAISSTGTQVNMSNTASGANAAGASASVDQSTPTESTAVQPPQQAGAGAPPINCSARIQSDCPPGTSWVPASPPTQGSTPLQNCGSQACPAGSTVPGTPEPPGTRWAIGMPPPDINSPGTTPEDVAAYNAWCLSSFTQCTVIGSPTVWPWPRGPEAEPSGRSLNWWGTDPRLLDYVNQTCTPSPSCQIPDGDRNVWNRSCSPQPTCRIRLSTDPPVNLQYADSSPGAMLSAAGR